MVTSNGFPKEEKPDDGMLFLTKRHAYGYGAIIAVGAFCLGAIVFAPSHRSQRGSEPWVLRLQIEQADTLGRIERLLQKQLSIMNAIPHVVPDDNLPQLPAQPPLQLHRNSYTSRLLDRDGYIWIEEMGR